LLSAFALLDIMDEASLLRDAVSVAAARADIDVTILESTNAEYLCFASAEEAERRVLALEQAQQAEALAAFDAAILPPARARAPSVAFDDDEYLDEHEDAVDENSVAFDRCGTFGCVLRDRHPGLHQFSVEPRRQRRSTSRAVEAARAFGFPAPHDGFAHAGWAGAPPGAAAGEHAAAPAAAEEEDLGADAAGDAGDAAADQGECIGEVEDASDEDADAASEASDEAAGIPRLAGRYITEGGLSRRRGAKAQSRSRKGFARNYSTIAQWKSLTKENGAPMFQRGEITGKICKPLGTKIRRLLQHRPEVLNPPSLQPANVRNASGFLRLTPDRIDPSETKGTLGSISASLADRVQHARSNDCAAMRAACGDADCPICRLPEAQQPDEPLIFHHNVAYWWNACRGKCMSSTCRRVLRWHSERKIAGDCWTLQRGDNRINHVPSNIIGVLCVDCNGAIPVPRCISDRNRTQL
jgi:hypothetical protein